MEYQKWSYQRLYKSFVIIAILVIGLFGTGLNAEETDSEEVFILELSDSEIEAIRNGNFHMNIENFLNPPNENSQQTEAYENRLQSLLENYSFNVLHQQENNPPAENYISDQNQADTIETDWQSIVENAERNQNPTNTSQARTSLQAQNSNNASVSNQQDYQGLDPSLYEEYNIDAYTDQQIAEILSNIHRNEEEEDLEEIQAMAQPQNQGTYENQALLQELNTPFCKEGSRVKTQMNDIVAMYIEYYTTNGKESLQSAFLRFEQYYPHIKNLMDEYVLPIELSVLPIVLSSSSASYRQGNRAGLWMMTEEDAASYQLLINRYIDERLDIERSTEAAFALLMNMDQTLKNIDFVIAAYVAGVPNVISAIRNQRSMDFWEVSQQENFNHQALELVAKFYAILHIINNPYRYGFEPLKFNNPPLYDIVAVNQSYTLSALAGATRVPLNILKRLNPQLKLEMTPLDYNNYPLKVPAGSADAFIAFMDDQYLPADDVFNANFYASFGSDPQPTPLSSENEYQDTQNTYALSPQTPYQNIINRPSGQNNQTYSCPDNNIALHDRVPQEQTVHRLQSGETLYRLSVNYGVSVEDIMAANNITDPTRIAIGTNIIIPNTGSTSPSTQVRMASRTSNNSSYTQRPDNSSVYPTPSAEDRRRGYMVYSVQPGDNLYRLSVRYQCQLDDIYEMNNLRNSSIVVGQNLRIPVASD